MSYAVSAAFQAAVFQALAADATLTALVGTAIFDAIPVGQMPELYVSLGPETVQDASDKTGTGALHRFTVSVVADQDGFHTAKTVAGAVSDVLHNADLQLARGRVVGMTFERATARQYGVAAQRQIDLRFKARVEDQ